MNSSQPRGGIFLSYRREDAAPYARLLKSELTERIRDARVFMDLDSIEPGLDFAEVIQDAVDSCAVLVALIGRQWLTLADEEGRRRLDNPDDYVRFEVQAALERGVRVIPVLVDGASPPRQQQLPAELHKLARLNAFKLSYDRYQYDADQLLDLIQRVLAGAPGPGAVRPRPDGTGVAGAVQQDRDLARDDQARTRRVQPPTHVVDAFPGRGDFTTVSAAIEAANPGGRILVRPGLYEEGLVVGKPLEIVGDGPVAEIEIRARDSHVLAFQASVGRVANLTLRQSGDTNNWYCVDITQGRLELEGCDISSQGSACVGIHEGAAPRLRRNKIHDGKQSGVYFYDSGLGTLEDNDITGNGLSGVEIKTGANPVVRGNRIHDNKQTGVLVQDSGRGTVEDNDITGNGLHGVEINTGANPVVRGNKIRDSKQNGILVQESGLGTVEDNDIMGNAYSGVEIRVGANPVVRGNQIHDNKHPGVSVHDGGLGALEDNDITGNGGAGVHIRTDANPTLRGNRINRNEYQGIYVYDGGRGVVEDNDLTGNEKGAWLITDDSKGNVTRARNKE